jgi:hypothetical protein
MERFLLQLLSSGLLYRLFLVLNSETQVPYGHPAELGNRRGRVSVHTEDNKTQKKSHTEYFNAFF